MPDWLLSILMLAIWAAVAGLFALVVGGLTGMVLGITVGYLVAGQVIQRFPGFWGK